MENLIHYPIKDSEAEVEALLWCLLRKRKIDARLQVTGFNEYKKRHCCKMDVVIFVDKKAKIIIECKTWSDSYARTFYYRHNNSKQLTKYRTLYKIPVLVCGRMRDINYTIKAVENHLNNPIVKEV